MLIFLSFKAAILAYAVLASIRARFGPGLAALTLIATLSLALPMLLIEVEDPDALLTLIRDHPWIAPLLCMIAGGLATRVAFRTIDREPDGSARVGPLEGAAYALLASTVIDAGLTVIGALATHLASRSGL